MSILPTKLQSFDYYRNLVPMYLQDVHGFLEQIKIFFDIGFQSGNFLFCGNDVVCGTTLGFTGSSVLSSIDRTFSFLDIFNMSKTHNDESSDILDKLAALFGVTRRFSVNVGEVKKDLQLSDDDLLILIKFQVIKNFFDGSQERLSKCITLTGLPIMILTDTSGHCKSYMLIQDDTPISENVQYMFLAGLLNIESMGIRYSYALQSAENIAIFDSLNSASSFDNGRFIL